MEGRSPSSSPAGLSTNTGLDWWTGLVDWLSLSLSVGRQVNNLPVPNHSTEPCDSKEQTLTYTYQKHIGS